MAKYARQQIFFIQQRLTEFRFDELRGFIDHSRNGMASTWKEFGEQFEKTTAGWDDDQKNEYADHIYDDIASLRDASPQLLRHAQCMMIFGTFENGLANMCRAVHRDAKIAAAPPGNLYTYKAKAYLLPHIGKRPAPFATEWAWLDEFRIFRNWMAHNGGRAQRDATPGGNWSRAQQFLRRNRGLLRMAQHYEIAVEDGLVDRALTRASDAMQRIHKATRHLYR
jgi:hypothetical protein